MDDVLTIGRIPDMQFDYVPATREDIYKQAVADGKSVIIASLYEKECDENMQLEG